MLRQLRQDVLERDLLGQQAQFWPLAGHQVLTNLVDRVGHALRHGCRIRLLIGARQANHHLVSRHVDTTTGASLRDTRSSLTVDDRLLRIRRVQFQPRTENILRVRADIHPSVRSDDEVNTQR